MINLIVMGDMERVQERVLERGWRKGGEKGKQCNFVLIKMYKNKNYKNGARGDGLAVTNT